MHIIKYIPLILFLIANNECYSMGLGDWSAETTNGTHFNEPGDGVTITLNDGTRYKHPGEWYFYKDHIIGEHLLNRESSKSYFVIDELESSILEFDDENSWKVFLQNNDLVPLFWTRWHSDNWNHMRIVLIWSIFLSPLLIVFIIIGVFNMIKVGWPISTRWKNFLLMTSTILFLIYLLSEFPGSI